MAIKEKLEIIFGVTGADKFKREFVEAEKAVQKSSKGITTSLKNIARAAAAYLSIQTARSVGQAVLELTKLSDNYRVVQKSSQRLAQSIGQDSNKILQAVRRGVGGAVSDLEILKQVNQAILLGIPVTARQMETMAVTATRLGRAVGRDAASALGDLVTGIGRMSPMILDNLGITIKLEEAYKGLGEGATDAQKKIAFFNAVMSKANEASEKLGEQVPTVGEKLDKTAAKLKNIGTRIGDSLSGPVNVLIERIDRLLVRMGTASERATAMVQNRDLNPFRGAHMFGPVGGVLEGYFDFASYARGVTAEDFIKDPVKRREAKLSRMTAGFDGYLPHQAPSAQFRGGAGGYKNPGLSRRMSPTELATIRMFQGLDRGLDDVMEPEIRDMTKNLEAGIKDVGLTARKEFKKIPNQFEQNFNRSLSNIQISLQALGLQGGGRFFGGLSMVTSGISGLNQAKQMEVVGDGFLDRIQPGLLKFTSAMSVFSGAVSAFGAASGMIAALAREDFGKKSDEEILSLANDPIAYNELGQRLEGQDAIDAATSTLPGGQAQREANSVKAQAQLEAQRRGLGGLTGSNAYSVSTSITETQANSILAVLETQRAQDAERNNLLSASLAVQTDMKFLMSINSGNILTFAG